MKNLGSLKSKPLFTVAGKIPPDSQRILNIETGIARKKENGKVNNGNNKQRPVKQTFNKGVSLQKTGIVKKKKDENSTVILDDKKKKEEKKKGIIFGGGRKRLLLIAAMILIILLLGFLIFLLFRNIGSHSTDTDAVVKTGANGKNIFNKEKDKNGSNVDNGQDNSGGSSINNNDDSSDQGLSENNINDNDILDNDILAPDNKEQNGIPDDIFYETYGPYADIDPYISVGDIYITIWDVYLMTNIIALDNGYKDLSRSQLTGDEPNLIYKGLVFNLPDDSTHTVKLGESIWLIAEDYLIKKVTLDLLLLDDLKERYLSSENGSSERKQAVAEIVALAKQSPCLRFREKVRETLTEWGELKKSD